jgi:hypothetical protein
MDTTAAIVTEGQTLQQKAMSTVMDSINWGDVASKTRVLGTVEVSWDVWHSIKPHPNQRFTAKHAALLVTSNVLATPLDNHRNVSAVIVGDIEQSALAFAEKCGNVLTHFNTYKVDGHSRTRAQAEGRAPRPTTVLVTLIAVADESESARVYSSFDSTISSKKGADKAQSAILSAGIEPKSALFQACTGIAQALKMAEAIIDEGAIQVKTRHAKQVDSEDDELTLDRAIESLVPGIKQARRFKDEILALDSLDLNSKVMAVKSPALAAYIAILHRDQTNGLAFITKLRQNDGSSVSGAADAIYVARTVLDFVNVKRKKLKGVERNQFIVAVILNAFIGYKNGATFDTSAYPGSAGVIASLFEKERRMLAKEKATETINNARTGDLLTPQERTV